MREVEQLIHARWIVPIEPSRITLEHHSVAVADERIVALLPRAEATEQFRAQLEFELASHVLLPGFVNTHTHAAMSLLRGLADDLPLEKWLNEHIWPTEARLADHRFVHDGTRLAAAEMLLGGTTCFNDMYFFPDAAASGAIAAGIRMVAGMIVIGFASAWATNTREYLAQGQKFHDQFRSHPLIYSAFAPHAPYSVDDDALRQISILAEELDVPIHMHVHETAQEVTAAVAANGYRPLARLQQHELISPRLVAVHMTCIEAHEMALLAHHGAHVVHCPESNLKLGNGFCPVQQLLTAGVNVALGTDGAASNNDLDMLSEIRSAALLAKGAAADPCAVPAHVALHMATLAGAEALGLETEIGSVKLGKQADLIAIDLGGVRAQPVFDPVSHLVYATHRDQVTDVWVAGRRVVANQKLVSLDVDDLTANARDWRTRIQAALE